MLTGPEQPTRRDALDALIARLGDDRPDARTLEDLKVFELSLVSTEQFAAARGIAISAAYPRLRRLIKLQVIAIGPPPPTGGGAGRSGRTPHGYILTADGAAVLKRVLQRHRGIEVPMYGGPASPHQTAIADVARWLGFPATPGLRVQEELAYARAGTTRAGIVIPDLLLPGGHALYCWEIEGTENWAHPRDKLAHYMALARARASAAAGTPGAADLATIVVLIIFMDATIRRTMQPRWERCYVDQGESAFTLAFGQLRTDPNGPQQYGALPGVLDLEPDPDIAHLIARTCARADFDALRTRIRAIAAAEAAKNGLTVTGGDATPTPADTAPPQPAAPGPASPADGTGPPPSPPLSGGQGLAQVDINDPLAVKRAVDAAYNRRRYLRLRDEAAAAAKQQQEAAAARERRIREIQNGDRAPHRFSYDDPAAWANDYQRYLREQQRRAEAAAAERAIAEQAAAERWAAGAAERAAAERAAAEQAAAAYAVEETRRQQLQNAQREEIAARHALWPWHMHRHFPLAVRIYAALWRYFVDPCA